MTRRGGGAAPRVRVPASRRVLIGALVVGGLGIGVGEFLVMGLLPQIAADLLPALSASDPDAARAATGGLASAYGLGVVVGLVAIPPLLRRLSERAALIACAASMLACTLATACAPTLAVALGLRLAAGLAHASYIGVSAMAIAHLLGSTRYGRGSAIVHGGLTAASLVGVPALTALGAGVDWRLILGGGALLFAVPLVALGCVAVPAGPAVPEAHAVGRVRAGTSIGILSAAVLTAAGGFALVTFAAQLAEVARAGGGTWLTAAVAMFAFGIGMNLGNLAAGWCADRAPLAGVAGSVAAGALGAVAVGAALALPAAESTGAASALTAAGLLLAGAMLGGCGPTEQVLYMRELRRFPRLASSLPSGTGNLGSFLGALAGAGLLAAHGAAAIPIGALALTLLGACGLVAYAVLARRARGAGGGS